MWKHKPSNNGRNHNAADSHRQRGGRTPARPRPPRPGLIGIATGSSPRQRPPSSKAKPPAPQDPSFNRQTIDARFAFLVGIITTIIVILVVAGTVWFFTSRSEPSPSATPLPNGGAEPVAPVPNLKGFALGNLISDEEFFDSDAMTQKQVETFINTWNTGCRTGADGTACLSAYREDTPTWEADAYCPHKFSGEANDSAASIIWKAAKACNINPKVLLTTLQKEQGLITASGTKLTAERYAIAMGYGCPDGTNCDSKYYGFAKQVYGAAHQFQMYRIQPEKYTFKVRQVNDVPYNVNSECGSGPIYIENQATAGLYNYTPYQPSPATLAGHNDECSTWGNMNFYGFYQAWFGIQR